ncbi:MAG: XRE family transcriptional regulator [Bacteroidaceae bacterium]|nr:XRE family transcriptional regulator [Bacteroidaceae bacterium]
MDNIIPDKIKNARLIRGLSMDQLVARMGSRAVSKMAISKIERGLMQPSQQTLSAIADACNVPVEFFCESSFTIGKLDFRFKEGTPIRKRREIEAQVVAEIQNYMDLNSNIPEQIPFKNPLKGFTVRNYPDLETAAQTIRKKWYIGNQPIFSVYELLQSYGIHIIETDIDDKNVDGVSAYINGHIPIIIVNTRKNETTERKRFTALHELAHLTMKFKPMSDDEFQAYQNALPQLPHHVTLKCPDTERLCNSFASTMLLPQESVFRRIGTSRSDIHLEEFIDIRNTYGISIAATIHRLQTLQVIDDAHYHQYYEEIIKPNELETGLGNFPIQEHATTPSLIRLRLKGLSEVE